MCPLWVAGTVSSRLRANAQLQLCGMMPCVRLPSGQCRKRAAADAKLEGDEQIAAESERLRQRCELFEQELQRLEKEKLEARDHADVLQHQLRWAPPCVTTQYGGLIGADLGGLRLVKRHSTFNSTQQRVIGLSRCCSPRLWGCPPVASWKIVVRGRIHTSIAVACKLRRSMHVHCHKRP